MSDQVDSVKCECYFKSLSWLCGGGSNEDLVSAGPARITAIIQASKQRGDIIYIDLECDRHQDDSMIIRCHRNCISTYTSKLHIKRHLSKQEHDGSESTHTLPTKRTRSSLPIFNLKTHCLFCGDECQTEPYIERIMHVILTDGDV